MKKLVLKVKANSKKTGVLINEDGSISVQVSEPPIGGKANQAVIRVLANYFNISSSRIKITHGHRSKSKLAEIE
jgi:hypothetical protein